MFDKIVNWISNLYNSDVELDHRSLPTPDFADMHNWSKADIDIHADAFGIKLDRRKSKDIMIKTYRTEYTSWLANQKGRKI